MDTVGASKPIIIAAAAGMFLATIWAARIGENASAGISCIVGSFLLSYALLLLGLLHNWYGIAPTAVTDTQRALVINWIVIVTMLILAALRMPSIFLLLFTLVDVSLVLNLLGIVQESASLTKAARVGPDGRLRAGRVSLPRRSIPRHRRQGIPAGSADPARLTRDQHWRNPRRQRSQKGPAWPGPACGHSTPARPIHESPAWKGWVCAGRT
jgi:hypothetical protein